VAAELEKPTFTSWDSYFYPGTKVFRNRLDCTDPALLKSRESNITFARVVEAMLEPEQIRRDDRIDSALYRRIHAHVFSDIYEWAGEYREIAIGKGTTEFAKPKEIAPSTERVFAEIENKNRLRGLDRLEFVAELAQSFNALNLTHAFREGNGRTQQLLWTYVAQDAGHQLDWARVSRDQMYFASADAADKPKRKDNEPNADLSGLVQMLDFATNPAYSRDPVGPDRANTVWMAKRTLLSMNFPVSKEIPQKMGGMYTGLVIAASPYHFALETGRGSFIVADNTKEHVKNDEIIGLTIGKDGALAVTRCDDVDDEIEATL